MTFLKSVRIITWLSLIDIAWYILSIFIFAATFYPTIINILEQATDAITQNTQALTASNNPLTTQIALWPFTQAIIGLLIVFIAIAAILGLATEWLKTRIIYKKPFWLKTALLQLGQVAVFIILLSFTQYLLYLELAYPFIPVWLLSTLIVCLWGAFFWCTAHAKAISYAKKKFDGSDLWQPIIVVAMIALLASTQIIQLIMLAAIIWIAAWNWYQVRIATFK